MNDIELIANTMPYMLYFKFLHALLYLWQVLRDIVMYVYDVDITSDFKSDKQYEAYPKSMINVIRRNVAQKLMSQKLITSTKFLYLNSRQGMLKEDQILINNWLESMKQKPYFEIHLYKMVEEQSETSYKA